jgi:hypothetical protein
MTDDAGGLLAVDDTSTSDNSGPAARVPSPTEVDGHPSDAESSKKSYARAQRKKRLEFLDDLLRFLDIAIYCQLSTLYYLE